MADLPTYHEAVTPADVVALFKPYVLLSDLPALCRVSTHYWQTFAPLLWEDVLRTARRTGLQPADDLDWWFKFVYFRLVQTSTRTASLVRVLDMRNFAKHAYCFASDQHQKTVNQSLKRALTLLPNLLCIHIDGHQDVDPGQVFADTVGGHTGQHLRMLSMPDTVSPLPSNFVHLPCLHKLVYLDISAVPGRIWHIMQPELLPNLRLLKVRDKEIDNPALSMLISNFGQNKLWSLDVSYNKLTDAAIGVLLDLCSPMSSRNDSSHGQYFDVEGKLEVTATGTRDYSRWSFVHESRWSGSFQHPNRYLVDAPVYTEHGGLLYQNYEPGRIDSQEPIKSDASDGVRRGLIGEDSYHAVEAYEQPGRLTHLDLSNNDVSSLGVRQLLDMTNGRLQKFACDSMPLVPPTPATLRLWPRSAKLHGFFFSHMLRPVFSSDLRTVRLHHSVVTQIPTLETDEFSSMSRLYIAETTVLVRSEMMFPQAFVPDTNPRLTSLTLTRIPRRSSGPLITKLINFLRLLSKQERDIYDTNPSSRRGPGVLAGLKHLRLEFEPDPLEDGFSMTQDLDAEELMKTGEGGFSFFDNDKIHGSVPAQKQTGDGQALPDDASRVLDDRPDQKDPEYVSVNTFKNQEAGRERVWVGRRDSDNPAIRAYHRLVMDGNVRDHAGPATPAQVLAGAPYLSVVFHMAWCMAIMPETLETPTQATLSGMKDVLAELKQVRLAGRAKYMKLKQASGGQVPPGEPHGFWLGKLEVSTQVPMSQGRSSQYWR